MKRAPFERSHAMVSRLCVDEDLGQVRVGAVARQPVEVVEEFLARVGAEIAVGGFLVADVGDAPQVLERGVGEAHHAAGEAAVAAGLVLGRRFQHRDRGALVLRRQRRAQRRIALADHDHIEFVLFHCFLRLVFTGNSSHAIIALVHQRVPLMPAASMTRENFAVSRARNSANCSGVLATTVMPSSREAALQLGQLQDARDLGVQLDDHLARRRGRREHAVPVGHVETLQARFRDRGNLRRDRACARAW